MLKKTAFILVPIFSLTLLLLFLPVLGVFGQATTADQQVVRAGISLKRLDRLGNYLERKIESEELPGATCLVWRRGETILATSYGHKNMREKSPMPNNGIFFIQSMTKPLISVALMILFEEGHFALTDPVGRYLPMFRDRKVEVLENGERTLVKANGPLTIGHLLTHTGGLLHGLGQSDLNRRYAENLYEKEHETIKERVQALAALPLVDHPGNSWHYSASTDVLALLIEHFSGKTVDEFLRERLFEPLEMYDTGYNVPENRWGRVVDLHLQDQRSKQSVHPQPTPVTGNTVFGGTHGLFSTPTDYLRFCQMLLNGGSYKERQLLGKKTLELMTVDHVRERFRDRGAGFGLGFGIRTDLAAGQTLGSEGQFYWGGLYNTYFFVDPKEELIGILMMQFYPYSDRYNQKFRQFVYQAIVD